MKNRYGNVVLITGASSGIGKAIAEALMKNGLKVYGTSRKPGGNAGQSDPNASQNGGFLKMVQLDVCSEESVKKAVDEVIAQEGRIDILINNAGFGLAGAVEDTSPEEAYKQLNTNFLGALRMYRAVLPVMRKQKKGLIINISSVMGFISIPYQSMYSASKYALESMSEVLRMEVKPFGIKVVLIEPGDIHTGLTENREFVAACKNNSVYKEQCDKAIDSMAKSEMNGPPPTIVVKDIFRILKKRNPPIRVVVGFSYKLVAFLKRILPSRWVEFIVTKLY